jgi:hypothetical protein
LVFRVVDESRVFDEKMVLAFFFTKKKLKTYFFKNIMELNSTFRRVTGQGNPTIYGISVKGAERVVLAPRLLTFLVFYGAFKQQFFSQTHTYVPWHFRERLSGQDLSQILSFIINCNVNK